MAEIKQTGVIPAIWPNQMIRPVGDTKNTPQKKKKSDKENKPEAEEDSAQGSKPDDDNQSIDEYA